MQGESTEVITLFLCGDVMTGRGIDQVLHHPSHPTLHESYVKDARDYVHLAEDRSGRIGWNLQDTHIWGRALTYLVAYNPDIRVVNLETSITTSLGYDRSKSVHYRMHPLNMGCLTALGIDVCSLANNHTLDWGEAGLIETIRSLESSGIQYAGAGRNLIEALTPCVTKINDECRVITYAFGLPSSGIPDEWAATTTRPGVNLWRGDLSSQASRMGKLLSDAKKPGDIAIASIHWGGNWGFKIPFRQRDLAHKLVAEGFDIIHGHSSHHVKGLEVFDDKLILYGCGDFITDYEGISGKEEYRDDLVLMYFAQVETSTGALHRLIMQPLRMRRFSLVDPTNADMEWLYSTLKSTCADLGTSVIYSDGTFELSFN